MTALVFALSMHASAAKGIEIVSPVDNAGVAWRSCVSGYLAVGDRPAWLIIRPFGSSDHFVQPSISLRTQGDHPWFRVQGYFGEDTPLHNGVRFEIQVVQNARVALREGMVLPTFPDAQFRSPVIEVVRDDHAPLGCGDAPEIATTSPPAVTRETAPAAPIAVQSTPFSTTISRVDERGTVGIPIWKWLRAIAALCAAVFAALILLPVQREEAAQWLLAHIVMVWATRHSIGNVTRRLIHLVPWTWRQSTRGIVATWKVKGSSLTFSEMVRLTLTALFLVASVYLMAIVDARLIMIGLSLVLHVDATPANILDDISALARALPAASASTIWSVLVQPVINLWNEPLGPAGLSLAVCHGAFAVVLYAGRHRLQVLSASLPRLFADRPMPLIGFVLLNVSLAVLAGYRAFQQSPDSTNPWAAAGIAFFIGLSIPWLMAYSVHVLTDATSDVAGITGSGATVAIIFTSTVVATTGVALATGIAALVVAATLALAIAAMGIGLFLVWTTSVFGELLTLLFTALRRAPTSSDRLLPGPARFAPIALLILVLLGSLVLAAAVANGAERIPQHEPTKTHRAHALVLDASLSPRPDQFKKAQQWMVEYIKHDVQANDLLWLVVIDGGPATARRFAMPFVSPNRSERGADAGALGHAKDAVIDLITRQRQTASESDLGDAINASLMAVTTAKRASALKLVVLSDFIEDRRGQPRMAAPARAAQISAARVDVVLLLTQPLPKYLRALQLSQTDLFVAVRDGWTRYFLEAGTATATPATIDAVAATAS
jgi:hypothetical protein